METYCWILSTHNYIGDLEDYEVYNDECLLSSFQITKIKNFIKKFDVTVNGCIFNDKYQYKLSFNLDKEKFKNIINELINFKFSIFTTLSIYVKSNTNNLNSLNGSNGSNSSNGWIKLWKKGIFYNTDLLK